LIVIFIKSSFCLIWTYYAFHHFFSFRTNIALILRIFLDSTHSSHDLVNGKIYTGIIISVILFSCQNHPCIYFI